MVLSKHNFTIRDAGAGATFLIEQRGSGRDCHRWRPDEHTLPRVRISCLPS
jgi:hypothetical protein